VNQLFKDCLTAKDGESYDVGRILLFMLALAFVGFTAADLFLNHHFDASSFGVNAGALLGGGGAGIGFKAKTEPDA
jgi:hypothetical protein